MSKTKTTTSTSVMHDAKPSEQLDVEVRELEDERKAMRGLPLRFIDQGASVIAATPAAARQALDDLLRASLRKVATSGGDGPVLPAGVADLWVLANEPELTERWQALLEEDQAADAGRGMTAAGFRFGESRVAHDARLAEIKSEESARKAVLAHRRGEELKATADAEAAALLKEARNA